MTERLPATGLRVWARGGLLCALLVCANAASGATTLEARALYRAALEDLYAGRSDAFERAKAQLTDYPLYPYLDYAQHRRRLHDLTPSDVKAFRERWLDVPVASRLYEEWLDDLAERGEWDIYLANYEPSDDVARSCYYLRALDRSGATESAMDRVGSLWMVGTNQPDACDPLFASWIARGYVTNRAVWDRLALALQARSWNLARHLVGLLSPEMTRRGDAFYHVAREPELIRDVTRFSSDDAMTRTIVVLGVRRLANNDPDAASAAWTSYRGVLTFDPNDARVVAQDLTIAFARRGVIQPDVDLSPSPDGRHLLVYEALIRAALINQDWPTVTAMIARLDEPERMKQRWQYWLGRAQRARTVAEGDPPTEAEPDPWEALADDRQFYGFLAATGLDRMPAVIDRPAQLEPDVLARVQQRAGMQRLAELYALDERGDARREWNMVTPTFSADERAAAAHVIADLGWVDFAIIAANEAELRDDLTLRFPTPFTPEFVSASRVSKVPVGFLYGIARQESLFRATARSSAGALGVMQLMPATAAATARVAGLPVPTSATLFEPRVNIQVASRHVAELMARFNGNRVLVAAAYNAGAGRVDQWLSQRPARPVDIWIETIPFAETRDYVKNVLAFTYIYGTRLGHPKPFLSPAER